MILSTTATDVRSDDVRALVAKKVMVPRSMVLPFADFTIFTAELLKMFYRPGCRLIAGGHVTPDINLAADRAEVELVETLGVSCFSSDPQSVLTAIGSPQDLVYLANPNRVTGANFSLSDLENLARAVPQGTIFIDEHYYDYLGVSGRPLLDLLTNVVILRSFTASFAISSTDAGFVLAYPETISHISDAIPIRPLPSTVRKTVLRALADDEALSWHLRQVYDESLRLATELSRLKVQCRITATAALLLRVADHKSVGNFLASYKIPVDNLDGYPQLEKYLRYSIQPPSSNDRLIQAFKKMPAEYFLMDSVDCRAVTMCRRPGSRSQRLNDKAAGSRTSQPPTSVRRPQGVKQTNKVTE